MTTLADSFLCDLQDLEDDDDDNEDENHDNDDIEELDGSIISRAAEKKKKKNKRKRNEFGQYFDDDNEEDYANAEEDLDTPIIDAVEDYFRKLKIGEDEWTVSELLHDKDFLDTLSRVKELTSQPVQTGDGLLEEMEMIGKCNKIVIEIDKDILSIHRLVRDIYVLKFPELESIVIAPLEYLSVIIRIGHHTDMSNVDLSDLLPSPTIMALNVAASLSFSSSSSAHMTTDNFISSGDAGKRLPEQELQKAISAANQALSLAEKRKEILRYLESRMFMIAPNVSALLGCALAARLLTHAGGLQQLATMPAQNIMLIGEQKRNSISLSNKGAIGGLLCSSEIFLSCPPPLRKKALRLLSSKTSLAARFDLFYQNPYDPCAKDSNNGTKKFKAKNKETNGEKTHDNGNASDQDDGFDVDPSETEEKEDFTETFNDDKGRQGMTYREFVIKALIKAQERPASQQKKALSVPDEVKKSRRGGKRHRRMKEKYTQTEVFKQLNRMKFGEAQETAGLEEKGLGMLGKSVVGGRIRMQVKQSKTQIPKKRQQMMAKNRTSSSSFIGGSQSCLAFTPVQGIELSAPSVISGKTNSQAHHRPGEGKADDYFSTAGKFIKVEKELAFSVIPKKV